MKNKVLIPLLLVVAACCSFTTSEWITFLGHDGTFKIAFPQDPEVMKHVVENGIIPLKSRLISYDVGRFRDENQVYQLVYSDYPDSLISSEYKSRITDTFIKNLVFATRDEIKGKIISIENITFHDFPGRHVHYTFNGGQTVMNMKLYLIKSRIYMLRVQCEPSNDNNASMDKFFDSFELIDKPVKKTAVEKK